MSFQRLDSQEHIVTEGRECVLIYGFHGKELETLKRLCNLMGLRDQILITPNSGHQTIEEIIAGEGTEIATDTYRKSRALVFHAVSSKKLNTLLENLKKTGIKRPLVAMVTETSKTWTFAHLLEELSKEKEALNANKQVIHKED